MRKKIMQLLLKIQVPSEEEKTNISFPLHFNFEQQLYKIKNL